MTLKQKSGKVAIVAGLCAFAVVWVFLMGLVTRLGAAGDARAAAPPKDDGSVKADITSIERENFQISLGMKITDRDSKVIGGLTEKDVEVYEDGQQVASFKRFLPAGQSPLRIGLVLDYTKTMDRNGKIDHTRRAARALIRFLNDQTDYLGLYMFNDHLFDNKLTEKLSVAPLDKYRREDSWDAIMGTPTGNGTPMIATMERALTGLEKVSGRRAMIVLTDGFDNSDEKDAIQKAGQTLAERSSRLGIPIHMLNMSTDDYDEVLMSSLARQTSGQYTKVPSPDKLKDILIGIGKSMQNEYALAYESPFPVEDGRRRKVNVVVRSGAVGTQANTGYDVPGVIATGSRSDGGPNSASVGTIFLSLAAALGLLYAAPSLVRLRRSSPVEDPGALLPPPAPVQSTRPSSQGVQPTRPSSQGVQPTRPSSQGVSRRPTDEIQPARASSQGVSRRPTL